MTEQTSVDWANLPPENFRLELDRRREETRRTLEVIALQAYESRPADDRAKIWFYLSVAPFTTGFVAGAMVGVAVVLLW